MKKSKIIALLEYLRKRVTGGEKKTNQERTIPASSDIIAGGEGQPTADPLFNTMKFDIAALLQPKTFLYLLGGTVIFLFQTYNTLAIIDLAKENEKLQEQLRMTSSVITAQELKVHELHSIHNITLDALKIGLAPSAVPPVELKP